MINIDEIESFTIIDDEDKEVECQVITAFEAEQTGFSYIVFTNGEVDAEGNLMIETSRYNPEAEELELIAITDEAEQVLIEALLDDMLEIELDEEE